jgi:hypothetical protein
MRGGEFSSVWSGEPVWVKRLFVLTIIPGVWWFVRSMVVGLRSRIDGCTGQGMVDEPRDVSGFKR